MIIFIDESGDAGFKTQQGSTPTFVIAMVIFDDELDAEETALKIKRHRQTIHKQDAYEFKFSKSSKETRLQFLQAISDCRFRVRGIVFRKQNLYSTHLKSNKDGFYNYAVKMLLQHNGDTIRNAKIRIDGLGEKEFRKSLSTYLRKELNHSSKVIDNLKFRDSNKDVLIQLADMIAGSIKRSYDSDKTDKLEYKEAIRKRLEDIWEFK